MRVPSPLTPERFRGEPYSLYVERRRAGNRLVDTMLKGQLSYAVSQIVTLPAAGVDENVDRRIAAGDFRQLSVRAMKDGTTMRVGRTKGVPYRKPKAAA